MSKAPKLKLLPVVQRMIWAAAAAKSRGSAWIPLDVSALPAPDADATLPIWIHVATEGTYKGHQAGEFTMDRPMFDQLITNLRNHPSFRYGADGKGSTRVVAFDWRHASEQSPLAAGAIDAQKAESWCYDLETRMVEGKLTLWSLTELLEPARTYIRQGKIAWTSVTIWPNAVHPISGENIGWYLSSIAFTNDPFVQGMVPIAASRYYDPYDKPEGASEVVERLRRLFGLAEMADLGQVLTQVGTLKAAATGAMAAPAGVDVNDLVAALRTLFNLRTLATVEEVFAEADRLLQALVDEEAADTKTIAAGRAAPQNSPAGIPPANPTKETTTMDPKLLALLALMAPMLGTTQTPEAVELAWKAKGLDRPGALDAALELPRATCHMLIATAKSLAMPGDKPEETKAQGATAKVKALLGALGVQDVDAACTDLLNQLAKAKEMMAAVPELEQMLDERMAAEDEDATDDIAAALELRGIDLKEVVAQGNQDPEVVDLVELYELKRTGGADLRPEARKGLTLREKGQLLTTRRQAKIAFYAKYAPKDEEAPSIHEKRYLTRAMFTQARGQQDDAQGGGAAPSYMRGGAPHSPSRRSPFAAERPANGGAQPTAPGTPGAGGGKGGGNQGGGLDPLLDLDRYTGNLSQRALAAAEARMGGEAWKKLDRTAQFEKAREVKDLLADAGVDLTRYMGEAAADMQQPQA